MSKYKKSISKLHAFAKILNISIKYTDNCVNATWYPSRNMIKVDDNLEDDELVNTLLHELGHVIDDFHFDSLSKKQSNDIYVAYKKIYKNKQNARQKRLVVRAEKMAWYYGRQIAKRLKINLGKSYAEDEKSSVASYRQS